MLDHVWERVYPLPYPSPLNQRHGKLRTYSKLRTALQHYSATVLQRYSGTASCEPSSDLLKISARSNTNENHALQTQFDQFSAPAVHLPFLASMPDVLEASLALLRRSATAGWVVEQPTPQPKCIQH